jgi:hypothetical protein
MKVEDRHRQEARRLVAGIKTFPPSDKIGLSRSIATALAEAEARGAERERAKQPLDVKRFEAAPCYLCGYKGHSYFQPNMHVCAERYHAAIRARSKP